MGGKGNMKTLFSQGPTLGFGGTVQAEWKAVLYQNLSWICTLVPHLLSQMTPSIYTV